MAPDRTLGRIFRAAAYLAVAALAFSPALAEGSDLVEVSAVAPGDKLPAWTFDNLNGAAGPAKVDLAAVLGKQPIVFVYWLAGHARSEEILQEVAAAVAAKGKGKVAVYGVANPPAGSTDLNPIRESVAAMKLGVPVLRDEGFRLLQELRVASVPFIAIVDKSGVLRLTNGGSLKQVLEYKMTLGDAIARVAEQGQLGTYGELPRYEPITEFVGKKPPQFDLPAIDDGVPRSSASLIASNKVTVFVFWSVDCPHCVKFMPRLNDWYKAHRDAFNLVGVCRIMNDTMKTKTQEFCRLNDLEFTNLADKNFEVAQRYMVTGTPTILLVRPDGVVDSVMPSGEADIERYFASKRKSILGKS